MIFFRSLFTLSVLTLLALISIRSIAVEWDWQPRESLTTSQQTSLNQYCRGSYIDQWQSTQDSNVRLSADLIVQNSDGTLYLKGGAELQQQFFSLNADSIESKKNQSYSAKGKVELRQKGQLITGDKILIATQDNQTQTSFDKATFLFHEAGIRGQAKTINSTYEGVIFIEDGFYTSCEPGSNSWRLYGSSIKLDPNTGFGTAKHVRVHIAGVPIFYFPWLRFPIDSARHSGFLFPRFGYSSSDGISSSLPYYANLAPNYDATITPNFVQNEGEGIDIELRHLNKYGTTVFEQSTFDQNEEGLQIVRKLASEQKLNSEISIGLLLEDNLTDDLYPEENTTSLEEKDNYERSAYAEYQKGAFNSKIITKGFQTPDNANDQPLELLPRVSSSYQYSNDLFSYQPNFQYTDFIDPDKDIVDGIRQVINQTIDLNMESTWGYFNPGLLSHYRSYQLNNGIDAELNTFSGYFDSGIVLERSLQVQDKNWRQTLEPKFSYLNAPHISQNDIPNFDTSELDITYSQAFSHTRFSGNDRIGDTEQITLGLESRFYDSNNTERWTLKLGQIFYLDDRRISVDGDDDSDLDTSDTSALLSSISYNENELISVSLDLNYDTEQSVLDLGQFSMRLALNNGIRFNSSYLYTTNEDGANINTKQSQISTILPLTDNWHLFYQHTYDWIEDINSKNISGVGFENCCIKASMSYQRLRNDSDEIENSFYLQFALRSLSNIGNSSGVSSIENDYWNEGNIGYK